MESQPCTVLPAVARDVIQWQRCWLSCVSSLPLTVPVGTPVSVPVPAIAPAYALVLVPVPGFVLVSAPVAGGSAVVRVLVRLRTVHPRCRYDRHAAAQKLLAHARHHRHHVRCARDYVAILLERIRQDQVLVCIPTTHKTASSVTSTSIIILIKGHTRAHTGCSRVRV